MGEACDLGIRKGSVTVRFALFVVGLVCLLVPGALWAQTVPRAGSPVLRPHYREGDVIAYDMHAVNQGRSETVHYEAHARGVVRQEPPGTFFEDFAWTDMSVEGHPLKFTPATTAFRQRLSVEPDYVMSIPGLAQVQPNLIGPITDLLTFYVDVALAVRQSSLARAGDHVYFAYGKPSSWADGTYTLIGHSSIDFDITLRAIDPKTQVATLVVRHVPPVRSTEKFPADWMSTPVGALPNNWIEVQKRPDGKYSAEVGQETFEDIIQFSLATGTITSATMDNPVDVVERDCDDVALTVCGAPIRYRIRRQITVNAV